MNLIKEKWTDKDKNEFQNFLNDKANTKQKCMWQQRIVNTQLPCLAIPAKEIGKIASQISKGNFLSFIKLWLWENYENTIILGNLFCKLKDFEQTKLYLNKYSLMADNWSTIDGIKFEFSNENKSEYLNFAKQLSKSNHPFQRRLSLVICLKLCKNTDLLPDIFKIANSFESETEYYVNMANAWLLCELFIQHKTETLKFLSNSKLNNFTINKMISKCHDSYRISTEDKQFLKTLKRK